MLQIQQAQPSIQGEKLNPAFDKNEELWARDTHIMETDYQWQEIDPQQMAGTVTKT